MRTNRRRFISSATLGLGAMSLATAVPLALAAETDPPVIDTHVHFYNPGRPQGVPWPPKGEKRLYRPILPADYRALPKVAAVSGVVVVEASAWLEDNQWILDLAANEPLILGFVGHLDLADDAFAKNLARFAANPLFRGVRLGGDAIKAALGDAQKTRRLESLADADLSLDALGGPEMLPDVARLAKIVPRLRVLIDHVASVRVDGKPPDPVWKSGMLAAGQNPNVFCKASGLVEGTGRANGDAPTDPDYYRPTLDAVWEAFGPDRLVFGSNWPVSELFASFAATQSVAMAYFRTKGREAFAKCFHGNSKSFYKWRERSPALHG